MRRQFTPKVVTANALLKGDVVYLTHANTWTRNLKDAVLLTDEADADLRFLQADAQTGVVVGAYLAEMRDGSDGPEPIHFREAFRCKGPSNYAHGKQEQF